MSRDHTIQGSPYIECAICAMTLRKSDASLQRGVLVCPDCIDSDGPNDFQIGVSGDDNPQGYI
jgi:hypothetical protein